MKIVKSIGAALVVVAIFIGCQKQLDFNTSGISQGTLKSDASGDCLPSSVNGIYKKDSTLTSSEYIDVNVNVDSLGTYSIKSDTVNGFSFKGNGTFGRYGLNLVRLYSSGKPTTIGTSTFTIKYGTSACLIDVLVLGDNAGTAIYTLGGAGGACAGFTLGAGTYSAGAILVAANSVTTYVNVNQTGTYTAGTDTINGIYFRTSNNFTTLGPQSITLAGYGTPIASGTFNYKLNNGSTICTLTIIVGGTGPTTGDYFPLSNNSWWSYDVKQNGTNQADTVEYKIIGTHVYNGNTYTQFEISSPATVPMDTAHCRKNGNDYFEYTYSDSYSGIQFDNTVFVDINFLKINAAINTTWSEVYTGMVGGIATSLQYNFKIADNNATVTVNGITYTNVIHVSETTMESDAGGAYFTTTLNDMYVAKNIGIIKRVLTDVATGFIAEEDIRYYKVF